MSSASRGLPETGSFARFSDVLVFDRLDAEPVVTLSGTVHDRMEKRRAEDIADSVLGVKDVQNQIRIRRDNE